MDTGGIHPRAWPRLGAGLLSKIVSRRRSNGTFGISLAFFILIIFYSFKGSKASAAFIKGTVSFTLFKHWALIPFKPVPRNCSAC